MTIPEEWGFEDADEFLRWIAGETTPDRHENRPRERGAAITWNGAGRSR